MENPMTWGKVKKAIAEALADHQQQLNQHICGLSDVSIIYNKLREKGFVVEDTLEESDNGKG